MKITIPCENCGEMTIEVEERKGGTVIRRGLTGGKSAVGYMGSTTYFTKNCHECGAYHGQKKFNHAERIKRLKDAGIPRIVRSEHVRDE